MRSVTLVLVGLLSVAANKQALAADQSASAAAAACALVGPCGDVDSSGEVTSSDALTVLRAAVGQPVTTTCECAGTGFPAAMLKTGQTACYDVDEPGAVIPCAGTGQDGELRKGLSRSFTDNGDGTITDNRTGLTWEKHDDKNQSGLAGIHDQNNEYTWAGAFVKVADLNFIEFAGHDDWRLPNPFELLSLLNLHPLVPNEGYTPVYDEFLKNCSPGCSSQSCSCISGSYFWTSATDPYNPSYAWTVVFGYGLLTEGRAKAFTSQARAVRGGP